MPTNKAEWLIGLAYLQTWLSERGSWEVVMMEIMMVTWGYEAKGIYENTQLQK